MRLSDFLVALPLALAAPGADTRRSEPAPLLVPRGNHELLPGQYIVKCKDNSAVSALDNMLASVGGKLEQRYENVFRGFAAHLDDDELNAIRSHPDVRPPPP